MLGEPLTPERHNYSNYATRLLV